MPNRDDRITLRQMLDHAREAVELVRDLKYDELNNQRVLCLALIQLCQIVGEAAVRVSKETQSKHPQIPWAKIISLRNQLIHGYDVIDYEIFWRIITIDLPALIPPLEIILQEENR